MGSRFITTGKVLPALILDMTEEPVMVLVLITGGRLILKTLRIDESVLEVLNNTFNFLLAATLTWLITRLYNSIHENFLCRSLKKQKARSMIIYSPYFKKGLT